MHGMLVGAMLGTAAIAFAGIWRSIQHWRTTRRRPPLWVLGLQVVLQGAIGVMAALFGFYFMLAGD